MADMTLACYKWTLQKTMFTVRNCIIELKSAISVNQNSFYRNCIIELKNATLVIENSFYRTLDSAHPRSALLKYPVMSLSLFPIIGIYRVMNGRSQPPLTTRMPSDLGLKRARRLKLQPYLLLARPQCLRIGRTVGNRGGAHRRGQQDQAVVAQRIHEPDQQKQQRCAAQPSTEQRPECHCQLSKGPPQDPSFGARLLHVPCLVHLCLLAAALLHVVNSRLADFGEWEVQA